MIERVLKGYRLLSNPRGFLRQERDRHLKQTLQNNFSIPIEETQPQDIFIAGYPKSGNTWMQSLISGLLYGIDTQYLPDRLAQEIVPDVHARSYYTRFGSINFFKSHHLPQPTYKRVIYLVRDGRDAMVSYYAYNKKLGLELTLAEMVKEGKGLFPGKWHEHVNAWMNNPYQADMMIVKYEDLYLDAAKELKRICEFATLDRNDELIQRVIQGNTLDLMREKAKKYNGMGHIKWKGDKALDFFRKGGVGNHTTEMENELRFFFENEAKDELKLFNYIVG